MVLSKLENMLENSLHVNLLLIGIVTQLASYPQPLLRSFLLNTNMVFQPSVRSLYQVARPAPPLLPLTLVLKFPTNWLSLCSSPGCADYSRLCRASLSVMFERLSRNTGSHRPTIVQYHHGPCSEGWLRRPCC